MTEQPQLEAMITALRQSQTAFLKTLDESNRPTLYQSPDADDWTLAEILVHITEVWHFYGAEMERALAGPGVKVGRTLDHEGRLQAIDEHGRDAPETIRQNFMASYEQLMAVLSRMTEADMAHPVENIRLGPQTLGEFIHRFLVQHSQAHVRQAEDLYYG